MTLQDDFSFNVVGTLSHEILYEAIELLDDLKNE